MAASPSGMRSPPGNTVERFNRLQKVTQDMAGAHHDMDFMTKQRKESLESRFSLLEEALRKLEAQMVEQVQERTTAEQRLRQDVEERISGVEARMESELGRQAGETSSQIEVIRETVAKITGGADSDKEEVQAALQKVRRDIEVTCETLLEEQMKLRGKVNEEFQAVHERLTEEQQLREASEERIVESLEGVSTYFTKGVELIR